METRRRRRGGKATLAASSEPSVRPPSPASESESGAESEVELPEAGATGVRSRDPPTTTLPGQGGLATPGDELRDTGVERVGPTSPHTLGAESLPPATEGQSPLVVERQDALAWGTVTTVETTSTTQVVMENLTFDNLEARNPALATSRNLTDVKPWNSGVIFSWGA